MKYLHKFTILTAIILAGFFTKIQAQDYGRDIAKSDKNAQPALADNVPVREVERAVFKRLLRLPYYGVFDHIAFSVNDDSITLFGKVAVARNKNDAERAVKRISAGRRVINNIEALPPSPFDDRIRRQAFRTLARSGLFRYFQEPNPSVRIIVDGGRLELEGYVANRGDYNQMNVLAHGISDVFSVKNNLVVENEGAR